MKIFWGKNKQPLCTRHLEYLLIIWNMLLIAAISTTRCREGAKLIAFGRVLCLCSAGGGVVHVGVMLRAAERGDGHGHGAGSAAGVRSGGGALPLRPQCWVLHLPPHQLRECRTAVQSLRTGLLRLQTQGKSALACWSGLGGRLFIWKWSALMTKIKSLSHRVSAALY